MAAKAPSFDRIAIVGLGLIGGSWGLALKEAGFRGRRIGYDRAEVLRRGIAGGAVDESAPDLPAATENADLVILAAPVGTILDLLPQMRDCAKPRALITDVGSTKRAICHRAAEIFGSEPLFLGGHPLAGKERSGLENASAALFQDSRYVLTPLRADDLKDDRVKAFTSLIESLGARVLVTDAARHDRGAAYLSHLPQLLSTGLASLIAEQKKDFLSPELAASGFRDMTRLAESPYNVWRDICMTNRENVQAALDALIQKLETMKLHLSDRDLEKEFKQAIDLRRRLRDAE